VSSIKSRLFPVFVAVIAAFLAGCASERSAAPPTVSAGDAHALIDRALPRELADRPGWARDIYTGFMAQALDPTHENICAVVAVIEQESGFQVNPVVPGLPAIAWKEIHARAEHARVPWLLVHGALELKSTNGRSYSDRIDSAKTEKDLSDIFEDFTGAVPLGRTLFADRNPIRTRGPMQVNVAFVKQSAAAKSYPYPVKDSVADEVFTRRGSVYFGIAHLLAYPARYDRYIYRFADYNAGQYASRNAAFQSAVSGAGAIPLVPDGALLLNGNDATGPGNTELAVRALGRRLKIDEDAIHGALAEGKTAEFERTSLYEGVFKLARHARGQSFPYAIVPRIKLQSPKITRKLTTEWYAHRVNDRFQSCLKR
jgi:Protein of unknown function (DUF1615)